jgi:hypothetical protein
MPYSFEKPTASVETLALFFLLTNQTTFKKVHFIKINE